MGGEALSYVKSKFIETISGLSNLSFVSLPIPIFSPNLRIRKYSDETQDIIFYMPCWVCILRSTGRPTDERFVARNVTKKRWQAGSVSDGAATGKGKNSFVYYECHGAHQNNQRANSRGFPLLHHACL